MGFTKEQRGKNLINLKNAIDLGKIDDIIKPTTEWGGAYVIVTSNEEDIFNSETDEDDWHGRKSQDIYVFTKHAKILSGLFYYIKENPN